MRCWAGLEGCIVMAFGGMERMQEGFGELGGWRAEDCWGWKG